jgi:hypothetical protein
MASNERITRPPLERTAPVRNWSTLLGGPTQANDGGTPDGATTGEARPGLSDVISRSVELGYRVVDEYVRQGQRAAKILGQGGVRPELWTGDARDLSQRMAQYASELVGAWFELLERGNGTPAPAATAAPAATTAPAAPTAPAAAPPAPVPGGAAAAGARLRIAIESSRRAEVLVDLVAGTAHTDLLVHALRACDAWKPRIEDVAFRADVPGEAAVLHVRIPAHHPPGTYEGLIIDAKTNRPAGVVRVSLRGQEPPSL